MKKKKNKHTDPVETPVADIAEEKLPLQEPDEEEGEEKNEPTKVFGVSAKDAEAMAAYEAYLQKSQAKIVREETAVTEEADTLQENENADEKTEEENELPTPAEFEEIDLQEEADPKRRTGRIRVVLGSLIFLVIAVIIVIMILKRSKEDPQPSVPASSTPASTAPVTKTEMTTVNVTEDENMTGSTGEPETFEEDTEDYSIVYKLNQGATEELRQVIEDYYRFTAECDLASLQKLYFDPMNVPITEESLRRKSGIIQDYREITCYSADGLRPDEMIVYVYYEILFKEIKTPAPTLIRFYMKQLEDGTWTIYNGVINEELKAHMDRMTANREVISLMVQVNRAFSQACEKDESLNRLITLMGVAVPSTEADTDTEDATELSKEETEEASDENTDAAEESDEGNDENSDVSDDELIEENTEG